MKKAPYAVAVLASLMFAYTLAHSATPAANRFYAGDVGFDNSPDSPANITGTVYVTTVSVAIASATVMQGASSSPWMVSNINPVQGIVNGVNTSAPVSATPFSNGPLGEGGTALHTSNISAVLCDQNGANLKGRVSGTPFTSGPLGESGLAMHTSNISAVLGDGSGSNKKVRISATPYTPSSGTGQALATFDSGAVTPVLGSVNVTGVGATLAISADTKSFVWHLSIDSGATGYVAGSLISVADAFADNGDSAGYLTFGSGSGTYPIQVNPLPFNDMNLTGAINYYFAIKGASSQRVHYVLFKRR